MKKVSVEQNLGKKNKCRFLRPRIKTSFLRIKLFSDEAEITPLVSQPLTLAGIKSEVLLSQFEAQSSFVPGFLVSLRVDYSAAQKSFDLSFSSPNTIEMLRYFAGEESIQELSLGVKYKRIVQENSFHIVPRAYQHPWAFLFSALMQLIDLPDYFTALVVSQMKQIAGSLRTFLDLEIRLRRPRKKFLLVKRNRPQRIQSVYRLLLSKRKKKQYRRRIRRALRI